VFLPTLSFLCFFCFMLICQLAIGEQKGGGFCHHRIEVIPSWIWLPRSGFSNLEFPLR
jgi:hypothetical protein